MVNRWNRLGNTKCQFCRCRRTCFSIYMVLLFGMSIFMWLSQSLIWCGRIPLSSSYRKNLANPKVQSTATLRSFKLLLIRPNLSIMSLITCGVKGCFFCHDLVTVLFAASMTCLQNWVFSGVLFVFGQNPCNHFNAALTRIIIELDWVLFDHECQLWNGNFSDVFFALHRTKN